MKKIFIFILITTVLGGCEVKQDDVANSINYLQESLQENFDKDWSSISYEDVGIILRNSLHLKYTNYTFKQTAISQKWSDSPLNTGNYYTVNFVCDQFPTKEFSVKLDKKNDLMLDEFPIILYENNIKQFLQTYIDATWEFNTTDITIDNLFTGRLYDNSNLDLMLSKEDYDLEINVVIDSIESDFNKKDEIDKIQILCNQLYKEGITCKLNIQRQYYSMNLNLRNKKLSRKKIEKAYKEV